MWGDIYHSDNLPSVNTPLARGKSKYTSNPFKRSPRFAPARNNRTQYGPVRNTFKKVHIRREGEERKHSAEKIIIIVSDASGMLMRTMRGDV